MPNPPAPQSVDAFHQRLQAVSESLPKRLRQCATYLAAHGDRIALSTVAELAQAAGVQPSALIRFCQIMGFTGFSEMQRLFRDSYAPAWPDYATRLQNLGESGADSPAALLGQFIEAGRVSLEKLEKNADPALLDAATNALSTANMVHIIGYRRAFAVAAYLDYAFDKMAVPCLLHDGMGRLDRRHALRPGDALLAISFAPYSPETVELAEHAHTLGLPVVAITDTVLSPLSPLANPALCVTEVDFGAFRALSATLALALALAVSVGSRRNGTQPKGQS